MKLIKVPETPALLAMRAQTQRREEVFAAFLEGHRAGMNVREPLEAWKGSKSRRGLATPLPPETKCKCGWSEFRLSLQGHGEWICDACLRPVVEAVPTIAKSEPRDHPAVKQVGEAALRGIAPEE